MRKFSARLPQYLRVLQILQLGPEREPGHGYKAGPQLLPFLFTPATQTAEAIYITLLGGSSPFELRTKPNEVAMGRDEMCPAVVCHTPP